MARKPKLVAANTSFWSGDTYIPIGTQYPDDHPEVQGREAYFTEVPAPAPAEEPPPAHAAGQKPHP